MAAASMLLELGALFAVLAVAGSLAHSLGQSVIPFYLGAGLLIDPSGNQVFGWDVTVVRLTEFVTGAAELGVVLLLFFLGLKFNLGTLVRGRGGILKAGTVDLANLVVGVGAGLAFGFSLVEALFLGGIVYISSSAVITKALIDSDWIANPESETVLGVLVYEDIFVALYLAILSALTLEGGTVASAFAHVGVAVGFMALLALVAWFGADHLGRFLDRAGDEIALLRALAVTVLVAGVALWAGLSEAVAAFFVGMAFGETREVERLSRLAAPLRDVFGAVFFLWIGLTAELASISGALVPLAVLTVLTLATKLVTGVAAGRIYGFDATRSVRVGVALAPRGEFSLVIAALAPLAGTSVVMTTVIPSLTVGYVLVTSVLGTLGIQHADWLEGTVGRLLPGRGPSGTS